MAPCVTCACFGTLQVLGDLRLHARRRDSPCGTHPFLRTKFLIPIDPTGSHSCLCVPVLLLCACDGQHEARAGSPCVHHRLIHLCSIQRKPLRCGKHLDPLETKRHVHSSHCAFHFHQELMLGRSVRRWQPRRQLASGTFSAHRDPWLGCQPSTEPCPSVAKLFPGVCVIVASHATLATPSACSATG